MVLKTKASYVVLNCDFSLLFSKPYLVKKKTSNHRNPDTDALEKHNFVAENLVQNPFSNHNETPKKKTRTAVKEILIDGHTKYAFEIRTYDMQEKEQLMLGKLLYSYD